MRDRDETATRILAAAFAVLQQDGFAGFGINRLAREASCDKQLIYRYFGGLDGVQAAMGSAAAQRLVAALDQGDAPAPASYGALIGALGRAYLAAMLDDPWQRQVALIEAEATPDRAAPFREARSRAIADWFQTRRGDLMPPPGLDAPAINAVLIGAVQGLALLGATGLSADDQRPRLEAALTTILAAVYGA